jgi:hypothetical protein
MNAPITHILPITSIQRERMLPIDGKVLVRVGQKVNPTDVIAEANLSPEYLLLDISRSLKVSQEKADSLIQYKAGDQVSKGDILAGPIGFTKRLVRAPKKGLVVLSGDGKILLECLSDLIQLKAGLPGEVVDIIPNRGVIIETVGALIQGVWGNQRVEFGLLSVLAHNRDHILTVEQIDISLRGMIILAGTCQDAEILNISEMLPLRGLIFSSIAPSLIPVAENLSIPIIVTDGFGRAPMNQAAYKLLSTNDQREVAMNAEQWDHMIGKRPEIIIPLPGLDNLPSSKDKIVFEVGYRVRIVRQPHFAEVGTIIKMINKHRFSSGLIAKAAELQLDNNEKVIHPLANLEVLA